MNKGHASREERTHLRGGKTTGLSVRKAEGAKRDWGQEGYWGSFS